MKDHYASLIPGYFYHVYNRGNNRENLFYKPDNYVYFLQKYDFYLNDYLETYAFCLLPNHFHLLIKVKKRKDLPNPADLEGLISRKFSNFFNCYAKAINKQQKRVGSLFQKNFKRILVDNKKYLTSLIYYIHANPKIHGLIDDFRNWPYSSYVKILIAKKTHLCKEEVLDWFGSLEEFKIYHSAVQDNRYIRRWMLEE